MKLILFLLCILILDIIAISLPNLYYGIFFSKKINFGVFRNKPDELDFKPCDIPNTDPETGEKNQFSKYCKSLKALTITQISLLFFCIILLLLTHLKIMQQGKIYNIILNISMFFMMITHCASIIVAAPYSHVYTKHFYFKEFKLDILFWVLFTTCYYQF